MKKIVLIIVFFVTLFLSGMVYFIVTIDKSFKQEEKTMFEVKKTKNNSPFHDYYYQDVS